MGDSESELVATGSDNLLRCSMAEHTHHSALDRILDRNGACAAYDLLREELPAPDLTTLLLEVAAQRTTGVDPADILRRYRDNRFVGVASVDALVLSRIELHAIETAAPTFVPLALAPTVPFGTHFVDR